MIINLLRDIIIIFISFFLLKFKNIEMITQINYCFVWCGLVDYYCYYFFLLLFIFANSDMTE